MINRRQFVGLAGGTIFLPLIGSQQATELPTCTEARPRAPDGYGITNGGNGGALLWVTTLADSGPGSLRAACDQAGARVIRFAVAGTIQLLTPLLISNGALTIDGSDNAITLTGTRLDIRAPHVIVRHLRIRPGLVITDPGNSDCLLIRVTSHVLIEYCSLFWSIDEILDISDSTDVTVRYCILSEALSHAGHPKGEHSKGVLITAGSTRVSFHHNLIAHCRDRLPYVMCGICDIRNNIIYNGGTALIFHPIDGPIQANLVNNYDIRGPDTYPGRADGDVYFIRLEDVTQYASQSAVYLHGNRAPNRPDDTWPEAIIAVPSQQHSALITIAPIATPVVLTTSPEQAYSDVLSLAGAWPRDEIDRRVVTDVETRTGQIVDTPPLIGA